jgi:tRNA threonylcarbamoyladenosine biosynthesis protein TsaE
MANRKLLKELDSPPGVICRTPEETFRLGKEVAALVKPGTVVSLEGPLGAGKTELARGIVAGLGSQENVSSPSFTLAHEYAGGRFPIHHFDFYRLRDREELAGIGYDDCLEDGVVVEWGEKFPAALPQEAIRLGFEILPNSERRIRRLKAK